MILFMNKRNECYLISSLQALFAIPSNVFDCESSNEFVVLFNVMCKYAHNSEKLIIKSDSVMNILYKYDTFFNGKHQEDAHECIVRIFDIMAKENKSFYDHFNIHFRTTVSCTKCDYLNNTNFTNQFIILNFSEKKNRFNLAELFDYYTQTEKLDVACSSCHKGKVYKYTKITKLPRILVIVFSKFNQLDAKVHVSKKINIVLDDTKHTYHLISKINHTGNLNSGHYTTDRMISKKWYNFNDHVLSESKYEDSRCYISIYKK